MTKQLLSQFWWLPGSIISLVGVLLHPDRWVNEGHRYHHTLDSLSALLLILGILINVVGLFTRPSAGTHFTHPAHPASPRKCLHCGYDLRATPDRCPECGSAADAP